MWGRLQRFADGLGVIGMAVAAVAVAAMMILIVLEIVARGVFDVSTLLSTEFSGYFLVVITFFGLGWTLRQDGFIRVDVVYRHLPGAARRACDAAVTLISLAVTAVLTVYLWSFTLHTWRIGETSIFVTRTPLYIPQLFMAVGITLFAVELLFQAGQAIRALLAGSERRPDHLPARTGLSERELGRGMGA